MAHIRSGRKSHAECGWFMMIHWDSISISSSQPHMLQLNVSVDIFLTNMRFQNCIFLEETCKYDKHNMFAYRSEIISNFLSIQWLGGRDSELEVPIFPIYSLCNGEHFLELRTEFPNQNLIIVMNFLFLHGRASSAGRNLSLIRSRENATRC